MPPNTWTARTPNFQTQRNPVFDVFDDRLWILGGDGPGDPTTFVGAATYDPATDSWTAISNLPSPAGFVGQHKGIIGGQAFRIGNTNSGSTTLRTFVCDLITNAWLERSSVAAGVGASTIDGAVLHDKVYLWPSNRVFDPFTDSWSSFAARPGSASGAAAVIGFRDKLHIIGGRTGPFAATNAHDVYDPVSDTWSTRAPLPQSRYGAGICAAGDEWLFIAGGSDGIAVKDTFWIYDPEADTWSAKAVLPQVDTAADCVMAVYDRRVWAYGLAGEDLYVWEPDVDMPGPSQEGWGILF